MIDPFVLALCQAAFITSIRFHPLSQDKVFGIFLQYLHVVLDTVIRAKDYSTSNVFISNLITCI